MEIKKKREFSSGLFNARLDSVINGDSNQEVARKIGVQPSTLSKWRNYSDPAVPSLKGLFAISQEYGCSIDYLVGNDIEPTKEEKPSTRQLCEMLLTFVQNTNSSIEAHDHTWDDDGHPVHDEFSLVMKLEYREGFTDDPYTYAQIGEQADADIFHFFQKYNELKNVTGLPAGTLETCVKAWLDEIDKKEGV